MTTEKHLFKKTYHGVFWTLMDMLITKGFPLVIMIVLARILGPEAFGLYGILIVFIAIGTLLIESGLTTSLIRHRYLSYTDYSTVFYLNLMLSLLVYALIYLLSPLCATFFNKPILSELIRVISLTFIIGSLTSVHLAILNKKMRFRKIALLNMPGAIVGSIVGLILAQNNYGIWSLVYMTILIQLITSCMLWIKSSWQPQILYSSVSAKQHVKFGFNMLLSGLIDTLFKNSYNLIIGKFYPIQSLAFFERARTLQEYPAVAITGVANKVSYPLLVQLRADTEHGHSFYKKMIQLTSFLNTPLILILAGIAKPLFLIMLGKDWLTAVPYFQILCLGSIFYPHHAYNLNVLRVMGRSDLFLKLEVLKKVVMVLVIVCSVPFGIDGLLWGMVVNSVLALYLNLFFSERYIQYSFIQQLKDMLPNVFTGLLSFAVSNYLCYQLQSMPLFIQITLASLAGLICYAMLNATFNRKEFFDHLKLIVQR